MYKENVDYMVTDAVTEINALVVGASPAVATASQYQTVANSIAMASLNAVFAQQQSNIVHQSTTVQAVIRILAPGVSVSVGS